MKNASKIYGVLQQQTQTCFSRTPDQSFEMYFFKIKLHKEMTALKGFIGDVAIWIKNCGFFFKKSFIFI